RSSLTPRSKRSLRVGLSGERFRVPIVYRLLATKSTRGPRLLTWCTRASDGSIEVDSPSEVGPPRRSWFSADGALSPRQSARAGCGPAGARRLLFAVRRTRSGRPPAFFFSPGVDRYGQGRRSSRVCPGLGVRRLTIPARRRVHGSLRRQCRCGA
ncbi:hypothetical protein NDU88_004019, partial [Pleurodeles waltl]